VSPLRTQTVAHYYELLERLRASPPGGFGYTNAEQIELAPEEVQTVLAYEPNLLLSLVPADGVLAFCEQLGPGLRSATPIQRRLSLGLTFYSRLYVLARDHVFAAVLELSERNPRWRDAVATEHDNSTENWWGFNPHG
jgi:hypothetical protein